MKETKMITTIDTKHAEANCINRKLDSLTTQARKAHQTYRNARFRNLKPIQSPAEVKANARYKVKHLELVTFCREYGIRTPKTWG